MIVEIWDKWAKITKTSKKGSRYWKLHGARCVSQIHGTKLFNMVYCVDMVWYGMVWGEQGSPLGGDICTDLKTTLLRFSSLLPRAYMRALMGLRKYDL